MLTPEEEAILQGVNFHEPALLLAQFNDLNRHSGSEDERKAALYIAERLNHFGIKPELLWPELHLSTPVKADLKVIGTNLHIMAKTPSYSMSTGSQWVDGELVYAPSRQQPYAWGELEYGLDFPTNPMGKIVLCEGVPSADKVNNIVEHGGVAAVFVQAGTYIHEGICTNVWGNPELSDLEHRAKIPVVCINRPDGEKLIEMVGESKVRVAIRTMLEEGWKACPLVVAKIPGSVDQEKFVLLHGHLDSWHAGIGDNALGDATLLEIARVLHQNRHQLKRSVWIAWWPGHSTGRFAGSAWFADQYALEIDEQCIAQINCESTGCINAHTYEEMTWTEDVDSFCRELILDVTGKIPTWIRPARAGDYSFFNIGVTSFFMLSSTIGKQKINELGYYRVYGCGGNLEWHTENDDLRLVDKEVFLTDTRLYLAGVFKVANAGFLPIDLRKMLDSIRTYIEEYQGAAGESFDLQPLVAEVKALRALTEGLYDKVREQSSPEMMERINDTILRVARKLIRISYTSRQEFKHDPAVMVPPIPEIAPVLGMGRLNSSQQKSLLTQLVRGRNRVIHTLRECAYLIKTGSFPLTTPDPQE